MMHGQECGDAPKRGSAPQRELCHQPIALHEPCLEGNTGVCSTASAHQVSPGGMAFPGEVKSDVKWDGMRVFTANS